MATVPAQANPARVRSLVFPREHGAWGILLVPLATGAAVAFAAGGGAVAPLLLFTTAALALFLLRTPVETLLETTPLRAQSPAERQVVTQYVLAYGAIAVLALGALFLQVPARGLLLIGAVAGGSFAAQAMLRWMGRETRLFSQLVGSVGLTSTAAGAYYVVTGGLDRLALLLWAAHWLFAVNQIHYVQLRIHAARLSSRREKLARGRWFLLGQAALLAAVAAAWMRGAVPLAVLLAFLPVLLRGALWFFQRPAPLAVHRLGFTELAHAIGFGLLLAAGWSLSL